MLVIVGQAPILRGSEKDVGVTALFVRSPTQFDEAKLGAEEVERRIEVAHAQHGVEISHGEPFLRRWAGRQRFPGETVFAPAAGQRISDHEQAVHLVNSASSHLIGSPLARYFEAAATSAPPFLVVCVTAAGVA